MSLSKIRNENYTSIQIFSDNYVGNLRFILIMKQMMLSSSTICEQLSGMLQLMIDHVGSTSCHVLMCLGIILSINIIVILHFKSGATLSTASNIGQNSSEIDCTKNGNKVAHIIWIIRNKRIRSGQKKPNCLKAEDEGGCLGQG